MKNDLHSFMELKFTSLNDFFVETTAQKNRKKTVNSFTFGKQVNRSNNTRGKVS